jgi:hypothetical protein
MERSLARYIVELRRPALGWDDVQALGARSRAAASELRREGTAVRFLRAVLLPEDDSCLLLYEAESPEVVGQAVRRADLVAERTAETVLVTEQAERGRDVREEPWRRRCADEH